MTTSIWKTFLSELRLIRLGNIAMFRTFDEESWSRVGTANGNEIYDAGSGLHHGLGTCVIT
jgi:hypothetical protein